MMPDLLSRTAQLWFDVERQYKTMQLWQEDCQRELWFDVERQYKTIQHAQRSSWRVLWFDVVRRYKTMAEP